MTNDERDERDEAKYEMWIMSGGALTAKAKHKALAEASLEILRNEGWAILQEKLKLQECAEYETIEAVIRKGDKIHLIKWSTFNKNWMVQASHGFRSIVNFKL